jgi:hypothetical protein
MVAADRRHMTRAVFFIFVKDTVAAMSSGI